jgi:hypothetical protein
MTVLSTTSSQRFHGSGSAGPFTFSWRFLDNADLLVYRIDNPDDNPLVEVKTLLTEGVDYSLNGAGSYSGGSLTLATSLIADTDLLLERHTSPLQQTDIRNQGNNFLPEVHEDAFDHAVMMIQDRQRAIDELEAYLLAVETLAATNRVTLYDAVGAADAVVFADASAGPVEVNLPAANDPSAKVTIIVKADATENAVQLVPDSGTVMGYASADMLMPDETVRLFPRSANNNWYRM